MIDRNILNRLTERQKFILRRRSQGVKDAKIMREVGLNKNAYYDEVAAAYTALGIDPSLETWQRTREFNEKFEDEFRNLNEADLMGANQGSKAKVGESEVDVQREKKKSRR